MLQNMSFGVCRATMHDVNAVFAISSTATKVESCTQLYDVLSLFPSFFLRRTARSAGAGVRGLPQVGLVFLLAGNKTRFAVVKALAHSGQ